MSELTPRQWRLYNFLKDQDDWIKQCEIAWLLRNEYNYEFDEANPFHDTNARANITDDIRAINKSNVIQKIILSSAKGVKLATEAEAEKYIKSRYAAIFRQLERARKIARKAGLDGQMRITFGGEREIVQAFTDSNAEGERWRNARRAASYTQKQAVAEFQKYIHFDAPMLSKIENGVVLPTADQKAAFVKVYS